MECKFYVMIVILIISGCIIKLNMVNVIYIDYNIVVELRI